MNPDQTGVTAGPTRSRRAPRAGCIAISIWREGHHSSIFFDYFDGQQLHESEDGLELRDVDAAYLEAFKAATEIWGEALRARRNPHADAFSIRDGTGIVVLELPFAEILESSRGRRLRSRPNGGPPRPLRPPSLPQRACARVAGLSWSRKIESSFSRCGVATVAKLSERSPSLPGHWPSLRTISTRFGHCSIEPRAWFPDGCYAGCCASRVAGDIRITIA